MLCREDKLPRRLRRGTEWINREGFSPIKLPGMGLKPNNIFDFLIHEINLVAIHKKLLRWICEFGILK